MNNSHHYFQQCVLIPSFVCIHRICLSLLPGTYVELKRVGIIPYALREILRIQKAQAQFQTQEYFEFRLTKIQ